QQEMEIAMHALLDDLERSGPEPVGAPLRGVAVLGEGLGDLFPRGSDALGRRRRRASAARLARRALSLATAVHGVVADRPDTARAWVWNAREVGRRLEGTSTFESSDAASCVRALSRAAGLALALPALPDAEDWQVATIAFADETVLSELHDALLELTAAAVRLTLVG